MYECLSFLDSYLPLGSHVMENYSLTKLAILSICLHKIRQQRQGKQRKYKYCKKEQIQRFTYSNFFISLYLVPLIFWQISYHINLLQLYKAYYLPVLTKDQRVFRQQRKKLKLIYFFATLFLFQIRIPNQKTSQFLACKES